MGKSDTSLTIHSHLHTIFIFSNLGHGGETGSLCRSEMKTTVTPFFLCVCYNRKKRYRESPMRSFSAFPSATMKLSLPAHYAYVYCFFF